MRKQAELPSISNAVIESAMADQARNLALTRAKDIGLTALGVGGALAGARGLARLLRRNSKPADEDSALMGSTQLPFRYPVAMKNAGIMDFLNGGGATSPAEVPWALPLYGAALAGGGLAGHSIISSLLDRQRKREYKGDLQRARNEFQQAMLSQYTKPLAAPKTAAESPPITVFQKLAEIRKAFAANVEKIAFLSIPASKKANWLGAAAGGAGLYALLSSVGAGAAAYKFMQQKQKSEAIDRALRDRRRQEYANNPPPIVAFPAPVPAGYKPDKLTLSDVGVS